MNTFTRILAVLVITLGLSAAAIADDTDIYLDPLVPSGSEPLVMFYIDFRQNLSGPGCSGANCDTLFSEGYLTQSPLTATKFDVLRAVLKKVLGTINALKIGFMMPHNQSLGNVTIPGPKDPQSEASKSNGGFIAHGFEDVAVAGQSGSAFFQKLDQLPTPTSNNTAHDTQIVETYFEFFRYLTGQSVVNAHNSGEDRTANPSLPAPILTADTSIESANGDYVSPLLSDCTKIFTIMITDAKPGKDNDSNFLIDDPKSSGGMDLNLSGNATVAIGQMLNFLKDADLGDGSYGSIPDLDGIQNVVTYVFASNSGLTPQGTTWAAAGGTGTPFDLDVDPDTLVEHLDNILKSILSVSTTFVAPSVPVNVFNRAETVNEVFLALFEADQNGLPLWNGNLKKVSIGTREVLDANGFPVTITELQDANGNQAIDVDGRLKRDAVTFWTDTASLLPPGPDEVAGADGRAITRGGAGQKIPNFALANPGCWNDTGYRNLYTEDPGEAFLDSDSSDDMLPLDCFFPNMDAIWTDLTADYSPPPPTRVSGSADEAQAIADFCFLRGLESDCATPRPWYLADPLHSRPRPVNYGARGSYTSTNPDIRILIGTNDGFMHMFENTSPSGAQTGKESWAFIPRTALKTTNRLRANLAGDPKHPNTTDGSPVVLTKDANLDGAIDSGTAGDQALAFFGMRRGGANIYALDITDPDDPKFIWQIIGGTGGTPGFAELTQTWSTPQVGKIRISGVDTDVLVFGGGYNGDDVGSLTYALCAAITASTDLDQYDDGDGVNEDDRTECFDSLGKDLANRITRHNKANEPDVGLQVGTDDPHGNAIYIVNAQTGALIWKLGKNASAGYNAATKTLGVIDLDDSFPAEITAADTTGNGLLDRIYGADSGGRVWRIDLADFVDHDFDSGTPDILVFDDPSKWTAMTVFDAGRHFINDVANDRRFFNRVDVAQTRDNTGAFDALLIGSGDREDPMGTATENWFYMIKDRNITSGAPPTSTRTPTDLVDLSSNCLQTDTELNCLTAVEQTLFQNGWRIQLEAAPGEKNLAASVTSGGNVFFSTYAPEPVASACGLSEGLGRFYALSLQDATAVINFDTTNDSGGITYERSDLLGSGGIPVEVVPLSGGQILVQGQEVGENIVNTGGKTGFRTYWHELPVL
jgi:type IV pilus assembly protein PilY1